MPLLLRCLSCCLLLLAAPAPVSAGDNTAIATEPQWLALLHMRRGIDGVYRSEVDAVDFFLSGRRDDPATELQHTMAALEARDVGPYSAWCRFPARATYLAEKTGVQPPEGLQCPDLDYWRGRFHTDEIVLVYPEPYFKNVASVFGHTFLRLDAADKAAHPLLLSKAISYYADVGSAGNTVTYIAKGLAGHFAGVIEVAPYFQKLRRYSDGEDRDIREYRLGFTPAQIRLFIDHVWEVRGHSFNYFFLDENCSYRLISMLDVITPSHAVREHFGWHAMPVDTVKALRDEGLVAQSTYIPSARKRFYEQLALLDAGQRQQLEALVDEQLQQDDVDDLQVLALSAEYSGIRMQVEPGRRLAHNLQVRKLVQQQYQSGQVLPAVQSRLQASDPINSGHDMSRLQLGWQRDDGKDFTLFGIRAAHHDLHDPQAAYQLGVQLDVLDLQLRVAEDSDSGDASIERLRWFGLQSYAPRDGFFREPSWGFAVARQREMVGEDRELLNVAEGYRGVSYACGAIVCHGEVLGGVLTGGALDLGWTARAGVRAGLLYQQDNWSWSADMARQYYLAGEDDMLDSASVEGGYRLARNLSLHGSYTLEKNRAQERDRFALSLRLFF